MSSRCRVCSKSGVIVNADVNDTLVGRVKYKDLFELIMGRKMVDAPSISPKMCNLCRSNLEFVAKLGITWKDSEDALEVGMETHVAPKSVEARRVAASVRTTSQSEEEPTSANKMALAKKREFPVKMKLSEMQCRFFYFEQRSNVVPNSKGVHKGARNFQKIKDFFGNKLTTKGPPCELNEIARVTIDRKHFNDRGQIADDWLKQHKDSKMWSDIVYRCQHCGIDIMGLMAYLKHLKSVDVHAFRITCQTCPREYSALYSYINHIDEHCLHLKFCCILCEPSKMFINCVCLLNHYMEAHSDIDCIINICLECGQYFQQINHMRVHYKSQHEILPDMTSSSDESGEEEPPKKTCKGC